MKTLIINTHLTYPGWSEGKLNLTFMESAKAFFSERGHPVAQTFVEQGYEPEEEVEKHATADLVIPPLWQFGPFCVAPAMKFRENLIQKGNRDEHKSWHDGGGAFFERLCHCGGPEHGKSPRQTGRRRPFPPGTGPAPETDDQLPGGETEDQREGV
jgi:hypothetical protein